ncbi:MAG: D-alanyl-D-alanine carboxypeptidase/D-alanyl-D-alanine-endopeptidase [Saprospiraceae bacterium]|nr:D-alanyl-D-alanine carboxypeptidase/D-alanyl-D-alanine-endopeptidase [Saprospiraceae bacterium]
MLKIKLILWLLLICFMSQKPSFSQDCADKVASKGMIEIDSITPKNLISEAVQRLTTDFSLRYGQVGVIVMDAKTGQILASQNETMSLIPASNMKIVSTAAGLGILGSDFQFRTELQYDGEIRDSILYGNIYIKGSGDPTLASPLMEGVPSMSTVLDSFSHEIKRLGIKKIVGKIVGDGSAFEPSTAVPTWLWEDLGNAYGAGPSGLSFHENLYDLVFEKNTTAGMPPSVSSIEPHIPDFQLINEVRGKQGGGDDAYIYATPYSSVGYVRGTIPTGTGKFTINGSIPDPPYFAAWHLRKNLRQQDVEVTDSATTQMILDQNPNKSFSLRKPFFTWYSPKLSEIVRKANVESVNLYCEAIVRAIGLKQSGSGSNEEGIRSIYHFWQSKGVNTEGLFMQDGSGLSPRNGISPLQLASMLRTVALDSVLFKPFYQSLPEPAKSGTLKSMFKNTPSVSGRLRAKSGTITRVKSYSGYVTTESGQLLVFSAICNNFTGTQRDIRKKLEQFMVDLCTP